MAVEVRQMVIKSTVGEDFSMEGGRAPSREQIAQIKAEILEECRAWFLEQMRLSRER